MPAKSQNQQTAAQIALAMQRGEAKAKPGSPSAKMAASMGPEKLRHFAKGKKKKKPKRKR